MERVSDHQGGDVSIISTRGGWLEKDDTRHTWLAEAPDRFLPLMLLNLQENRDIDIRK